MGKPTIYIGENKGADPLISAFVFVPRIVKFLFYLNPKFKPLAIFCDCTDRYVSDLFGNHIVGVPTRRLICHL